ncbi:DNA endonuclease SmrA [Pseudidiomarina terrestris]|uniref:DNA endonuclease SmrA n=1 Tax=Pseudidiomarina terrestris TaxID=2820060 RepID=A0AAW7QWZ3_9GAMM|nr:MULTISPECIES: DNA endonuclease SmrA [unclassified Pseudidiomarina]MDN7124676.1 DNA endonuclease SmrA [Pseudidiomarina sp. 1APP75-32.1]MDN7126776.1 DNA endonuclease SmrA [Pseudidiomarina sp. 1APR75-33.1]MDN7129033.1 DNA endonuclease SmrA [Pseudidiomarina sp. 1APR75-15]MDN7134704.1 DNA endonuclease SmrA [Pseudidiomarina sp. 1ASP75-5]MDN7136627.1 DNA endonuclease SmrA [Pseudidiomarina sp. 1ASP75-14]
MSDDFDEFLQEMAGVKPLASDVIEPQKAKPTAAQAARRKAAEKNLEDDINYLSMEFVDFVEPEAMVEFRRDGVQHGVFKRLKQGQYTIEATLDLHHHSLRRAREALFEFIQLCHRRGVRSAIVVHGMGRHSKPHPALLKSYVAKWLQQLEPVMAYHSAQRHHGGAGSVYVMLRKNAEQKHENRELHQKRQKQGL